MLVALIVHKYKIDKSSSLDHLNQLGWFLGINIGKPESSKNILVIHKQKANNLRQEWLLKIDGKSVTLYILIFKGASSYQRNILLFTFPFSWIWHNS